MDSMKRRKMLINLYFMLISLEMLFMKMTMNRVTLNNRTMLLSSLVICEYGLVLLIEVLSVGIILRKSVIASNLRCFFVGEANDFDSRMIVNEKNKVEPGITNDKYW